MVTNYLPAPSDASFRTETILQQACLLEKEIASLERIARDPRTLCSTVYTRDAKRLRVQLAELCALIGL